NIGVTDTADGFLYGGVGVSVNPAKAIELRISGPTDPLRSGDSIFFSVRAIDPFGNLDSSYSGTVHFSSGDPQATLPPDFTFTSGDRGYHGFTDSGGTTLRTAGVQQLTVTDAAGLTGTATIAVEPAYLTVSVDGDVNEGQPTAF